MKICERNAITRLSLGIALVLGSAVTAEAATFSAFNLDPTDGTNLTNAPLTIGTRFEVLDDITVTAIGILEGGADGDQIAGGNPLGRTVTLWRESDESAVISQTIVETDTTNIISTGGFRYFNLAAAGLSEDLTPGFYRLSIFVDNPANGVPVGDYARFELGEVGFGDPTSLLANPIPNIVQLNLNNGYPSQGGINPTSHYRISANILFDDQDNGGGNGPTVPEPSLMGGLILFGLSGLLQKRSHQE